MPEKFSSTAWTSPNSAKKNSTKCAGSSACLFQGAALLDSMSVFDNVAFPLREKTSTSESDIKKKVDSRLEQVGLGKMGGKFPAELSGGMKKRAGLARALIMDPEIVLFDEPTTGLDPVLATSIHQLIARTQNEFGYTGIIVSHTIPQVLKSPTTLLCWPAASSRTFQPPAEFSASANPVVSNSSMEKPKDRSKSSRSCDSESYPH